MFRLGIAVPHIVAGDNLDIPVVGRALRGGGGFFIRRTFAGDQLYSAVIKEYVEQVLGAGKNLECFIEGTRSRTGKRLPPKLGILKYVVEALLNERTEDVYVAPVSVQYDSVIER
jgi:glycerol-3-phosphate O-acyltransferase